MFTAAHAACLERRAELLAQRQSRVEEVETPSPRAPPPRAPPPAPKRTKSIPALDAFIREKIVELAWTHVRTGEVELAEIEIWITRLHEDYRQSANELLAIARECRILFSNFRL